MSWIKNIWELRKLRFVLRESQEAKAAFAQAWRRVEVALEDSEVTDEEIRKIGQGFVDAAIEGRDVVDIVRPLVKRML